MNVKILPLLMVNLRTFLMLVLGLLISLYIAWFANAQIGYGYAWLYKVYEIDKHIEKYAPHNRYRDDFEFVKAEDHKAIFQNIVDSVHDDGKGLQVINYRVKGKTHSVLHAAEIVHLQDVALLITRIHYIALLCIGLFVLLAVLQLKASQQKKRIRSSNKGLAFISVALLLILFCTFVIIGSKRIFYQMHIWVFPQDHQWFFYYQDSLMSTLMKAPDLFAGIALQILMLAILIFTLGIVFWQKKLSR